MVTADKETARILKGTEVPYQETSQSGATSVAFREASLSLEVTPQITPDGKVIMTVKVTKDEPDFVNALNDVPPIRKNEVNAKVRVADGETIVIGVSTRPRKTMWSTRCHFSAICRMLGGCFDAMHYKRKIRAAGLPDSAYHE